MACIGGMGHAATFLDDALLGSCVHVKELCGIQYRNETRSCLLHFFDGMCRLLSLESLSSRAG